MTSDRIEDIHELSPLQQGMLFHALEAPEAGLYFEQVTLPFPGYVNAAALRRAWQTAADRHGSLRSAFVWEDVNKPVQMVHRRVALAWREEDWSGVDPAEQQALLAQFLADDRASGLDIGIPPLMRLALVRLGPAQGLLVWSFHHLLLDGWSALTVLQEVSKLYAAYAQGGDLPLPPAAPFSSYIAWLRKQDRAEADRYWRSKLEGLQEPTPLGVSRTVTGTTRGFGQAETTLPPDITRALRDVARRSRLTVNALLQGSWALLLSRYSGERDVAFGTVVSGRPPDLPGVQSMVGMFINTLPVRVHVDEDEPIETWLRRLQDDLGEMQRYQYSPLVDLHRHTGVPRSEPLFRTLFAYENYGGPDADQGVDTGARFIERTNYPLTAMAAPGASMVLRVLYFTDLFDRDTIDRLLSHWRAVLTGFATGTAQTLRQISLMSTDERDRLVGSWSGVTTAYPREATIPQLFDEQVRQTPDAPAVTFAGETLTYRELKARADRIALSLIDAGVEAGDLVGVCIERSQDLVPALLGILEAGAAYLPLDPANPAKRLAFMVEDAGARVILAQDRLRGVLPATSATILSVDGIDKGPSNVAGVAERTRGQSADALAYVMYTSGSTGQPKGVAVPHRGVVRLVRNTTYAAFGSSDVFLQFAPVSFDASTLEIWAPLLNGGRLVVHPPGLPSIEDLAAFVRTSGVTAAWFSSALFDQLVDTQIDALRALHAVFTGGDVVSPARIRRMLREAPAVRIVCGYGPTENTTFTACFQPADESQIADTVPIGKPIANTTVYVLDAARTPVPIGVPGEIYTGGDGLGRYWKRPELTDERFVADPFGSGLLYRTGDRGRFLPSGDLEFLGRIDRQVKLRGFRIELGEIEAALNEHPLVGAAVATVYDDGSGTRRLVAYVVPRHAGMPPDGDDLRRSLGERLPEYIVPASWILLPDLPLNANGKVDRDALPSPDLRLSALEDPLNGEESWTPTEQAMAALWRDVLHVDRVGIHADFIRDLGGHSLLATQLVSRMRREFDVELPLSALFEHPTIAGLAPVVEELILDTIEELSDAEAERLQQ